MASINFQTTSAHDTVELGRRLAEILRIGDVVALIGPLGAGKTQLTRGIAQGLGLDPRQVASPTFILMSEYEGRVPLVHIDAYRIRGLSDLESIGFTDELLSRSITVIEWADRITPDLPLDHLRIELNHTEEGREITMTGQGAFARRMPGDLKSQISNRVPTQPCRTCAKPVAETSPTFPFCSDRCRLVDLNQWFTGGYGFSRPLNEEDDIL